MNIKQYFYKSKLKQFLLSILLLLMIGLLCVLTLCVGDSTYELSTVFDAIIHQTGQGATFIINRIRLPRLLIGLMAGFIFGITGSVFQNMLKNVLASPDVLGVTTGTSLCAIFLMLQVGISGISVVVISTLFGILVALCIFLLANNNGFNTSRLVLIGIGCQAFMSAFITFIVQNSGEYQLVNALRWLSGSLNGVQMKSVLPLIAVTSVMTVVLILINAHLRILQLGDTIATSLGVRVNVLRILLIVSSILMIAVITSVTGPISAVSFLSAPIVKRILKNGECNLINSGLMGAIIIVLSDFVSQNLFSVRYPVGVVTGLVGAPYLLYLLLKGPKETTK